MPSPSFTSSHIEELFATVIEKYSGSHHLNPGSEEKKTGLEGGMWVGGRWRRYTGEKKPQVTHVEAMPLIFSVLFPPRTTEGVKGTNSG